MVNASFTDMAFVTKFKTGIARKLVWIWLDMLLLRNNQQRFVSSHITTSCSDYLFYNSMSCCIYCLNAPLGNFSISILPKISYIVSN